MGHTARAVPPSLPLALTREMLNYKTFVDTAAAVAAAAHLGWESPAFPGGACPECSSEEMKRCVCGEVF